MRPTKGVHLLVPRTRLPIRETMVVMHPHDKRVSFAIPIDDLVVIGTSDTDHPEPSLEPGVTADDVTYMLEGVNHLFPEAQLTAADVYTSYAGLRPLVFEAEKSESEVSREHTVFTIAPAVYAIAGGKLTTWRIMASDVLRPIMRERRKRDLKPLRGHRELYRRVLPGVGTYRSRAQILASVDNVAKQHGLPAPVVQTLLLTYGARTQAVIEYAKTRPDGFHTLGTNQLIAAAFDFAVAYEDALTLDDLLRRRSRLFYTEADQGRAAAVTVAQRVASLLGWSDTQLREQVAQYHAMCDLYRPAQG
jgi:glycerol-3-phosphate dehydrogenase